MRNCLLLLIFPIFTHLFGGEEIVVRLASQLELTSVYLAPIADRGSTFDATYLKKLEKILEFDFDNNGKTEIVSKEACSAKIESSIHEKALSVKWIPASSGTTFGVEGQILTGDLHQDRKILHRIHDAFFESLFDDPGIADTRILYTVRTRKGDHSEEWIGDVWTADYDGGNARKITTDQSICVTPAFIPPQSATKCSNFLYVSYKIGQPKIYAASLSDGNGRRLTFLRGNQLMPAVSPKLDKLAFISDITGNPDLFVQEFSLQSGLTGEPRQVFCAPGATQGSPTFNPEGEKLAFVSNKDGTPRIYILDIPSPGASLKSIKPTMITKKTRENTCPAWSPDGKKIAYSALISGTRQICIYDIPSGEEIQLTEGNGHKENPAWAANSLHLIFNSSTPTSSDLYLINLNQKKTKKISNGPGEKRFPAWEPKKISKSEAL
jgi:TolB protein